MQIATQNPKSDPDFLAARGLYVSPGSAIVTCYGSGRQAFLLPAFSPTWIMTRWMWKNVAVLQSEEAREMEKRQLKLRQVKLVNTRDIVDLR